MRTHTRTPRSSFALPRLSRRAAAALLATGLAVALPACAGDPGAPAGEGGGTAESTAVTLVVHDSFGDPEAFSAAASAATGYDVEVVTAGDGGELTNKLVLTKGAPIADAFFGVDDTFASRLIDNGVVESFLPDPLPARAAELGAQLVPGHTGDAASVSAFPMIPIDLGATCMNIDSGWFAENDLTPPQSYEDLADARYRGLTVVIDPTASSTGAAFLTGTVAAYGETGYLDYWKRLVDNDVRIESGWTEAYNGQFTQGGEGGTHPVVLSYSTSPAWTLSEDGETSTTEALLGTCTTQIEYAGVLAGAANPAGAQAVVEYLLSRIPGHHPRDDVHVPGRRRHRAAGGVGALRRAADGAARPDPGADRRRPRDVAQGLSDAVGW
ncbi:thiamine ABC transporter substrate-binding protein [Leucobacter soli]|uniref:thiamine ABC transporter substrate-binding protein n=1 Tax=Leucobacter soli TaxID=2812850 RepID=UPI00360D230C